MENAIHDMTDGNMPVLWAAKKHGLPKSSLHDRISGKVSHGDRPGPKPSLTAAEESEIGDFLVEVSQAGYGKTRREVRQIAGRVAVYKRQRDKAMVSHASLRGFCCGSPTCHIIGGTHCECSDELSYQGSNHRLLYIIEGCSNRK